MSGSYNLITDALKMLPASSLIFLCVKDLLDIRTLYLFVLERKGHVQTHLREGALIGGVGRGIFRKCFG